MTYKEQLNKIKELGIDIIDISIAYEFECVFGFDYTDEEFENICSYAKYIYLKSEYMTYNALALCINDLITNENYTIEDIVAMGKYDFIEKASYYL